MAFMQWMEYRALLKFIGRDTNWSTDKDDDENGSPQSDLEMASVPSHSHNNLEGESGAESPNEDMTSETSQEQTRPLSNWTAIHCWYAVMGGFILERGEGESGFPIPNGLSQMTLTAAGVQKLASKHPHVFPTTRASEIIDKSKSNGMAIDACLPAGTVVLRLSHWPPLPQPTSNSP